MIGGFTYDESRLDKKHYRNLGKANQAYQRQDRAGHAFANQEEKKTQHATLPDCHSTVTEHIVEGGGERRSAAAQL